MTDYGFFYLGICYIKVLFCLYSLNYAGWNYEMINIEYMGKYRGRDRDWVQ